MPFARVSAARGRWQLGRAEDGVRTRPRRWAVQAAVWGEGGDGHGEMASEAGRGGKRRQETVKDGKSREWKWEEPGTEPVRDGG